MEENKELLEETEADDALTENASEVQEEAREDENGEEEETAETEAEGDDSALIKDILEIVESTLVTVFVIVLLFTYILHPVNIVGGSMENTLKTNDRIFMSTVYFDVSYGDIIIIDNNMSYLFDDRGQVYERNIDNSPLKECIIKRVIACGGQTLDIVDGVVYVDGKAIDEPYANGFTGQGTAFNFPITIPEGYYFVMGDHRNASTDSRFDTVGLIKKDQIYGKAIIRYSPFSSFKLLFNSWKKSSE
jgi:signal peptidase I